MADLAGATGSGADSPSSRYEKIEQKLLGEGTYGEVYKVLDNVTNEVRIDLALKTHG